MNQFLSLQIGSQNRMLSDRVQIPRNWLMGSHESVFTKTSNEETVLRVGENLGQEFIQHRVSIYTENSD